MLKTNRVKILFLIVKLTVFLACLVVGFKYLNNHKPDWEKIQFDKIQFIFLPFIILLSPINWLMEAIKWKKLMALLYNISLMKSVKATFSGIAVSFITPFRIGDFFGKVIFLESQRKKATYLTFYGNFTQLMVTFIFGITFLTFLQFEYKFIKDDIIWIGLISAWSIIMLLFFFWLYPFHTVKVLRLHEYNDIKDSIANIKTELSVNILLLSVCRYVVFTFQYVLAFKLFGSKLSYVELYSMIPVLYLLITFIPGAILGKLGVRESVSLFLFGPYEDTAVILSASILIWGINLFLPSILGSYYLLIKKKIK